MVTKPERLLTFLCVLSDHFLRNKDQRLCSLSNRRSQVILSESSKQKTDTIVFVFVFLAGFYNRCPTYLFFPNHTSRYVCEDSWEEPLFDHSLVCRSSSPDQNKVWIHKQHCGTGLQHLSKKVFIRKAVGQHRGVSRTFLTTKWEKKRKENRDWVCPGVDYSAPGVSIEQPYCSRNTQQK